MNLKLKRKFIAKVWLNESLPDLKINSQYPVKILIEKEFIGIGNIINKYFGESAYDVQFELYDDYDLNEYYAIFNISQTSKFNNISIYFTKNNEFHETSIKLKDQSL